MRMTNKFISVILSLLIIIALIPFGTFTVVNAACYTGGCGNHLTYKLVDSTGLLTISGTGDMYDYSPINVPWYSYRNTINAVEFEGEVTRIGDYAFYYCRGLTSITIPDSVTSIGSGAFYYCTGLTSITIPEGVTSIGEGAFFGCSGLESITVDGGNKYYHSAGNRLIETASKTLVAGCKNSIIPNDASVTSIGCGAFSYCTGLTSITIPDSVTSIGEGAFYYCTGLTSITIPEGVTSIGDSAFSNCTGLTSITIPEGVTSIGSYAFDWCTGLTSITIPEGVTSIGEYAFSGCKGLTSVTIGNSVTSIGYYAFQRCTGLTSITIPDSVTSISRWAFEGCTGLTSVTIGNSVTLIDYRAFYDCSKLKIVYYNGTQNQRNQISIGNNNADLTNAEWIYNCTAEKAEKCETLRNVYLKTAIQKKSGAKPTDSSYNLRLISMLDLLSDYSEVGFHITIEGYNDGENDEPIKYSTDTVYTSFLNGSTRVNASDYGAGYFSLVNITVPNEYYSANIKIKPYIVFADGTEFSGNEINTTVSKYIK